MNKTPLMLALTAGAVLAAAAHAGDAGRDVRVRVTESGPCPVVQVDGEADGHRLHGLDMRVQKRGFLGVEATPLTPELRRHFGVAEDEGVMIGKVVDDSAAFRAGLEVGDIITRVGETSIEGAWDLTSAVRGSVGGDAVMIELWRDGRVERRSVVLDTRETCTFDMSGLAEGLEELHEVLPGLHLRGLEVSEEAMEEVMESLRDIDWQEHLEKLEHLQHDEMDVRMDELHRRLDELTERLGHGAEALHVKKVIVLEEQERARLEREIEARHEMHRARIEAQRGAAEAAREAAEAASERREADRARAEAEREAEALMAEAERAAAEARAEALMEATREAEGGGDVI